MITPLTYSLRIDLYKISYHEIKTLTIKLYINVSITIFGRKQIDIKVSTQ